MATYNAIVGQSGGCTAVINQTLAGVIDEAGRCRTIGAVWGMRSGITGVLRDDLVRLDRMSPAQRKLLRLTPASALGSCRHKLGAGEDDQVIDVLAQRNIGYFFLIGGNDTAQTSVCINQAALRRGYPLSVIALPKTIDNDLPFMDHTPGYGSNARFIAWAVQEAGRDTEAMKQVDPIKIIEVMGRNSGWLVAAAALGKRSEADAPHLMYFPERPFSKEIFLQDIERVYRKLGYAVVVCSETIRDANGRRIGERTNGAGSGDAFGHMRVEGAAAVLAGWAEDHLKVRARFDKPGTIQRMSMKYCSPLDQREAYEAGRHGVRLAVQGKTALMVTIERVATKPYRSKMGAVPVESIAGVEKYLPDTFITPEGTFVTKAFLTYARPLVGELPAFVRL